MYDENKVKENMCTYDVCENVLNEIYNSQKYMLSTY